MADKSLTQEYLHHLFDYKDGHLYWKNPNSYRTPKGKMAGTLTTTGYYQTKINRNIYLNHRLIYLYHYGNLPKYIDHIDIDKKNNKIENLRETTPSDNKKNVGVSKSNTSGYKNVYWHKQCKKWGVRLVVNGKPKHIGLFENLELSDLVAQEARDKYHGKFARDK